MITGEHNAPDWVVVGVDGSPGSEAAIGYAAAEARRRGAGLRLVHVLPSFPQGLAIAVLADETSTPTGRALLSRASESARHLAGDVPIECRLLVGDRRDAIIEAAQDAGEIVLGHDPTPSAKRLATGSTVIGVAARAHVPVVAVTPSQQPGQQPGQPHGVVAVAIKHPRHAAALLELGFAIAAERGASVRFVHAWEFPPGYEGLAATQAEREALTRNAAEPLTAALASVAAAHPGVEHTLTVVHANPAKALAETSETCDLLVLERREHVLPRGHIGGTARALLHHAACPLMIVAPGPERSEPIPAQAAGVRTIDPVAAR